MTTTQRTGTVVSADGTTIGYTAAGSGPALVLVDGALCWREAGVTPDLLPVLSQHFTVYAFDRRGRGSSDGAEQAIANAKAGAPVHIEREIEDLRAVMDVAGPDAALCGFSSGAVLAMYAVQAGIRPSKLVLFEPPLTVVKDTDRRPPADAVEQLQVMVADDRRGDAFQFFMVDLIGVPKIFMLLMKTVLRKGYNSARTVAHTLPYDVTLLQRTEFRVPLDAAASIEVPTAVILGEKSPTSMVAAVRATAAAIPGAEVVTAPGMSHMVKAKPFTETVVQVLEN